MKVSRNLKYIFVAMICLCAVTFDSHAQYDISIEIKNSTTDTLLLGYFNRGATYSIDTALNKKNKFSFKSKTKKLDDGIYFFANTKGRHCEFMIFNEYALKFFTTEDDWTGNLRVKGSKNEELYLQYMIESDGLAKQYNSILNGRDTIDKQEYDSKLKILSAKNDSLKKDFIDKYPNHLLSKIFQCAKPIEIPNFPTIYTKDGSVDSLQMKQESFNWYKQHYFDNIDFAYGGLLNTEKKIFMDKYNEFWDDVMKYEKIDTILYYAHKIISRAIDDNMFNFLVYDITKRYLQSKFIGHDKIYVEMVDKYFSSNRFTAMTVSDIEKNILRADKWRNLLIGKQVPDLGCPTHDDKSKWYHLDGMKTKYKLLVFWSVDCGHCTVDMPKLKEFYDEYRQVYDFDIFAVHTENRIEERDEFLKKHEIKWTNTNGLFATYDWREYFDIEKTPVIYILDSKDKILMKNISVSSLKQVFDILEKDGFNL